MLTSLDSPRHAVAGILESLDSLDVDSILKHVCADARLNFGQTGIARGRAAIRKFLIRTLGQLDTLRCQPVAVWTRDRIAVIELDVAYERADGGGSTLPATIVLRFAGRAASDIGVYAYAAEIGAPRKRAAGERAGLSSAAIA